MKMKKILLIAFLTIGLGNIAWGGFFDSTCDAVEERDNNITKINKELKNLHDEAREDQSKIKVNASKSWELQKKLSVMNGEQKKECKDLSHKCKGCENWKKLDEESEAMEKSWRESEKRTIEMLSK
jgi:hypothetical protein